MSTTNSPIYIYTASEEVHHDLSEVLHSYRCHLFSDLEALKKHSDEHTSSGVYIFDFHKCDELIQYAKTLVHLQADQPGFVFFTGKKGRENTLIELLCESCHDFFTYPFNTLLVQKKVQIAVQIVRDKCALMDASAVLERYSHHIDQVAAERTRQLIHSERLSTLGVMSTEIAHEIKTPVAYASSSLQTAKIYWNNIESYLDSKNSSFLADKPDLVKSIERIPAALDRVDDGLERVSKLTTGLKKFGRRSLGKLTPLDLNGCVEESLTLCEGVLKTKVQLQTNLLDQPTLVMADAQQIEQVLVNLLVNAVHALEGAQEPLISIASQIDADQHVTLSVQDNGPGVPSNTLETIWEPFYTTKESDKGTGLGLAISRSILMTHGGTIEVSNAPSGGARFEIRLPLVTTDK
jgi:C4-dicarboxylate-specific signal transduction histidine kinase